MPIGYAIQPCDLGMSLVAGAGFGSAGPNAPQPSTYHGQCLPLRIVGAALAVTTEQDLWPGGGLRTYPTAGFTLGVVSSSASDVNAGTGAQQITINFLDASYNQHQAVYALPNAAGTTWNTVPTTVDGVANASPQTALRVNYMEVTAAGSGGANAGTVYAGDSSSTLVAGVPQTATKILCEIIVGYNMSSNGAYTMPNGYRGIMMGFMASMGNNTATVTYGRVTYSQTSGANGIWLPMDMGQLSSQSSLDWVSPELFPIIEPKTDLRFQGNASTAIELTVVADIEMWSIQ